MPIRLQIRNYKKDLVEKLTMKAGKVLEIGISGNTRGDYFRVRVWHSVREPLTKCVSLMRGKER